MARWIFLIPPAGAARQTATSLLQAFQETLNNSSVHVFDCKKYLSAFTLMLRNADETLAVDLLNQSLVVQCLEHDCTHLFVPALSPVTLFTLHLLQKQHITCIHWFIEDYRRATYWKDTVAGYTWFLAVQNGPLPEYCKENSCRFAYIPTAASDEFIADDAQSDGPTITADVVFIGLPSSYRITVLEYLLSQGITPAIAGEGWDTYTGPLAECILTTAWVDSQHAARITQCAAAAINFSFKEPVEDGTDSQISPRVYDILASNTILLTEDVPLMHETLGGCHYYTFTDKEDAARKVRQILSVAATDDTKQNIEKNKSIILEKHTWKNRAEQIIELCS